MGSGNMAVSPQAQPDPAVKREVLGAGLKYLGQRKRSGAWFTPV